MKAPSLQQTIDTTPLDRTPHTRIVSPQRTDVMGVREPITARDVGEATLADPKKGNWKNTSTASQVFVGDMVIRERLCSECELWSIPPTNGEDKRTRDDELGGLNQSMGLTAPGE